MQTLALVSLCAMIGQTAPANLDFSQGTLAGWDGAGFHLIAPDPKDAGSSSGVSSGDAGNPTRKGMIRFVLKIPPGARKLLFRAYADTPLGIEADARLDVILTGEDRRPVPKQLRTTSGAWSTTSKLLSSWEGKPRDYAWDVAALQGRLMQVVLIDRDERPGCHVVAAGFRFLKAEAFQDEDFVRTMVDLQKKHGLASVSRYSGKRFTALSNASEKFSTQSVRFCEIIYDLFYHHFERKGFALRPPSQMLMLAVFDGPDGFDAYMNRKMPAGITGIYHQGSNRLVIYDLRKNRALLKGRDAALKKGPRKDSDKFTDLVHRQFDDLAKDFNVSTTMHEAAHQLSFNSGLLNRGGDVAVWLAEGLACYCESTEEGDWQAIGSVNRSRLAALRMPAAGKRAWLPLEKLIASDRWLESPQILQGYSQSWALFHLLMHEETPRLRSYLKTTYSRQSPERRLEDFQTAFGDVAAFETRYLAYMRKLVEMQPERGR